MGSMVEINDTLQLTREQGFPAALDLEIHLKTPYTAEDFKEKVFEFKNKSGIRLYKAPPVRNFLVENRGGKWIYWGLVHVLEMTHHYENNSTSGRFAITYIYTPDEMRAAHDILDRNAKTRFFE
ncbi:MAG: hypothetical protein Q7S02_00605 [bacterium]|nr:hypothetical protein [bacterium]